MTIYLSNSFSLSMLAEPSALLRVREASNEEVKSLLSKGFVSAVGHEATAKILSVQLGLEVPTNRVAIKLGRQDVLVVHQLMVRPPEGKILNEEEIKAVPSKFFLVFYATVVGPDPYTGPEPVPEGVEW